MSSRVFARSAPGALLVSILLSGVVPAQADELPVELMALLEAANAQGSADFTNAVRLIALTRPAEDVVQAAETLGRGNTARRALGIAPVLSPEDAAGAAAIEMEEDDDGEDGKDDGVEEPSGLTNGVAGMPMSVARTLVSGRFELWEGRASLGIRFDSGNTSREDYTFALQVRRELSGWGFQGNIDYAYSEVNGTIGRDNFRSRLRGEREAGERFTYFAAADYERDEVASYDWTGFMGVGAGYRVFTAPSRTWILRAGPGLRFLAEPGNGTDMVGALDLGSDLALPLTESIDFTSESSLLVADTSRIDQIFGLNSALNDLWSLRLQYRYRYEFEPRPGFVRGDSRTDISIVREF